MNRRLHSEARPGSIEAQIAEYNRELQKLRKQLGTISIRRIEEVMRLNAKIEETKLFIEILSEKLRVEA